MQGKQTKDAAISQGKKHVDAAVSQGEKDVDQAKAVGTGYVEQVRGLAQGALDTAKVMVSQRSVRRMEANYKCPTDLPPRIRHRRASDRYRQTPEDDE